MNDLQEMLANVQRHATAKGVKPSTVLQYAVSAGADRYDLLVAGKADMTSRIIQRVNDYIAKAEGR